MHLNSRYLRIYFILIILVELFTSKFYLFLHVTSLLSEKMLLCIAYQMCQRMALLKIFDSFITEKNIYCFICCWDNPHDDFLPRDAFNLAKALPIVFIKSIKPSVKFAIHEEMLKQFLEFKHVNQAFGINHTFSPSTHQHATPAQLLAQMPK